MYDYAGGRLGCWMPAGREIDHAMRDAAEDFGSEREDDEEMEDARSEYSEDSCTSVVSSGSAMSVATTGTTASASSTAPAIGQRARVARWRTGGNMQVLPAIDERGPRCRGWTEARALRVKLPGCCGCPLVEAL